MLLFGQWDVVCMKGHHGANNTGLLMQDPPFRHTGMVQHDLDGNLRFLHRTYLGKFDPSDSEPWREMDFVTRPLSPQQAVLYSEAYGFFPHQVSTDFEKYCCPDGSRTADASQCDFQKCSSPGDPLPILTIAAANLDPEVQTALGAVNSMFSGLQSNLSIKSS
ncbi:hypothetical protein MMC14_009145 [Varicellaria rhodocarpa]|nr:hypothetical protein [Varicellaria rhodocarpa]